MFLLVEATLIYLNFHLINASYDTKKEFIEGNESDTRIITGSERNHVIGKLFTFKERMEFYKINLEYLEKFDVHDKVPFTELSKDVKWKIYEALKFFYASHRKIFQEKFDEENPDYIHKFMHPPVKETEFHKHCSCICCTHNKIMYVQGYDNNFFEGSYRPFGFDSPFFKIDELFDEECFKCPVCETFHGWKMDYLSYDDRIKIICEENGTLSLMQLMEHLSTTLDFYHYAFYWYLRYQYHEFFGIVTKLPYNEFSGIKVNSLNHTEFTTFDFENNVKIMLNNLKTKKHIKPRTKLALRKLPSRKKSR